MERPEFEKSKVFITAEISDYKPNSVVVKNIMTSATGNVSVKFVDKGEALTEKYSRFDNLLQIIEGEADVLIDDHLYHLVSGESIIIPANCRNTIKAIEKFKMISTIIKSGYE